MKFKKGVKVETDSFWYDIFEGGYIEPKNIIDDKYELEMVENAIGTLEHFFAELERQNKLIIR